MARPGWRRALGVAGSLLVGLVVLAGGALVAWNMFGQSSYGGSCRYALGCKSFYCVHRAIDVANDQVPSDGFCTKACDADADCGTGARCVVLGAAARDDLPPLGKPTRACMPARGSQPAAPR